MQIKNTLIWILIQHLFLIIAELHHATSWLWKKNILLELKLNWSDQLLFQTRGSFLCQVWKSVETYRTDVTADVCSCRPAVMSVNLQLCYCDNVALKWCDPVGRHVVLKGILPVLKGELRPLFTHTDQGQEPENILSPAGINMKLFQQNATAWPQPAYSIWTADQNPQISQESKLALSRARLILDFWGWYWYWYFSDNINCDIHFLT